MKGWDASTALSTTSDSLNWRPAEERIALDLALDETISLTFDQCTISGNATLGSEARGGGIFAVGNVFLHESDVTNNSTAGGGGHGGGVFTTGVVSLNRSTVSGNSTTGHGAVGGGIYAYSRVQITRSTISGNTTTGIGSRGGGMWVHGNVFLTLSTVDSNSTSGSNARGGGIYIRGDDSVSLIDQSTISRNSTAGDGVMGSAAEGGGIAVRGDLGLINSTISGNRTMGPSSHGGGIWAFDTYLSLTHCTVAENQAAAARGGGIYQADSGFNRPLYISGSIVASNTADDGGADVVVDPQSPITATYSLIGTNDGTALNPSPLGMPDGNGNLIGTNAALMNPWILSLADNGGPTQTHDLVVFIPPFSFRSPAIDAGDPSIVVSPTIFDQRGGPFVRVFDDDGVGGPRIDMGAFERQTVIGPPLPGDFNDDGHVNTADYVRWRNSEGDIVAPFSGADADGNGMIDDADYQMWKENFGSTMPAAGATTPVSEPTAMVADQPPVLAAKLLQSNRGTPAAMRGVLKVGSTAGSSMARDEALLAWMASREPDQRHENQSAAAWESDETQDPMSDELGSLDDAFAELVAR